MDNVVNITRTLQAGEKDKFFRRKETLLALVSDAYKRMATNRDPSYRELQLSKCRAWLEELTEIFESGEIVDRF